MEKTGNPSKNRIVALDVAKGLCILYVPFYHIVFVGQPFYWWAELFGTVMLGFYFVASGYTFHHREESGIDLVIHRAKGLLAPCLCWLFAACVAIGIFFVAARGVDAWYLFDSVMMVLFRPELLGIVAPGVFSFTEMYNCLSPVWFVWTMFLASCIYLPLVDWALRQVKRAIGAIVALVLVSALMIQAGLLLPWNFQAAPFYAALMLTGALLRTRFRYSLVHKTFDTPWGSVHLTGRHLVLVSAACVVFLLVVSYMAPTCYLYRGGFGQYGGLNTVPFYFESIAFSILIMDMSFAVCRVCPPLSDALSALGRNTLALLVIHGAVAMMLSYAMNIPAKLSTEIWSTDVYPWNSLTPELFWSVVVCYVLTVAICVAIVFLVNKLRAKR